MFTTTWSYVKQNDKRPGGIDALFGHLPDNIKFMSNSYEAEGTNTNFDI